MELVEEERLVEIRSQIAWGDGARDSRPRKARLMRGPERLKYGYGGEDSAQLQVDRRHPCLVVALTGHGGQLCLDPHQVAGA